MLHKDITLEKVSQLVDDHISSDDRTGRVAGMLVSKAIRNLKNRVIQNHKTVPDYDLVTITWEDLKEAAKQL